MRENLLMNPNQQFLSSLNSLQNKSVCPDFFLTGKNASLRDIEEMAISIVYAIDQHRMIPFKGGVKYFSIQIPYLTSLPAFDDFMTFFKKSLSIARDCYDKFCGCIILELEEWEKHEINELLIHAIDSLEDLVQNCCLIMVAPGSHRDSLYKMLARSRAWVHYEVQTHSPEECVEFFTQVLLEDGYKVSETAKCHLLELLDARQQNQISNLHLVKNLAERIIIDRSFSEQTAKQVDVEDIPMFTDTIQKSISIGFAASISKAGRR